MCEAQPPRFPMCLSLPARASHSSVRVCVCICVCLRVYSPQVRVGALFCSLLRWRLRLCVSLCIASVFVFAPEPSVVVFAFACVVAWAVRAPFGIYTKLPSRRHPSSSASTVDLLAPAREPGRIEAEYCGLAVSSMLDARSGDARTHLRWSRPFCDLVVPLFGHEPSSVFSVQCV